MTWLEAAESATTAYVDYRHTFEGEDVVICSFEGERMRLEIAEVHRCRDDGLLESRTMPLDETVAFAANADEIRVQIGLVYHGDLA